MNGPKKEWHLLTFRKQTKVCLSQTNQRKLAIAQDDLSKQRLSKPEISSTHHMQL